MKPDKIKIGIVGVGFAGKTHSKILSEDERVEIFGCCDINEGKSRALANKYGAKSYADYRNLMDENIDSCFITLPNFLHAECAIHALENDIHVFLEKPPAISLDDMERIVSASEQSKAKIQIGYNYHFSPLHRKIKEIAGEEEFFLAHVKMVRGEFEDPAWLKDPEMSGGLLYESASHVLNFLSWLFGDVLEVRCKAKSNIYDQLDDFIISLEFENSILASITSSAHASWVYPFERIELFGDHSTLASEEYDRLVYSPGLDKVITNWDYTGLQFEERRGYVAEDRKFIEMIAGNGEDTVKVEEGLKTTEIIEACLESARKGGEAIPIMET